MIQRNATPFSVETLLLPIREEAPGGDSLRYEDTYRLIQAARTSDGGLPQGVWQKTERRADWREVERLCSEALQTRTKDLQIAVWLSEAWIHTRFLTGAQAGLELLTGLHEAFLLTMYPRETPPDADTLSADIIEHRANLMQTYSERISLALKFLPVASPAGETETPAHTLADFEKAQHEDLMRRRANGEKPAEPPFERFEKEMAKTPPAWLLALDVQLAEAESTAHSLDALLDRSYGQQNGGLGNILSVLASLRTHLLPHLPIPQEPTAIEIEKDDEEEIPAAGILSRVKQLFSVNEKQDTEELGYDVETLQEVVDGQQMTNTSNDPSFHATVASRSQAFAQLRDIAEFLARVDPHSPVPFLLRRAVRWGSMDFQELLPELMRNQDLFEEAPLSPK